MWKNKEKKYSRNSNNLQLNNEIEDKQEQIISPKIKSSIEENSKSYDDEESSSLTSTGKEEVVLHFEEESPSSGTNDKKNEIDFTPQSSKTVNVRTAVKRKYLHYLEEKEQEEKNNKLKKNLNKNFEPVFSEEILSLTKTKSKSFYSSCVDLSKNTLELSVFDNEVKNNKRKSSENKIYKDKNNHKLNIEESVIIY